MAVAVAALLLAVLAPAASAAPHSVVKRLTVGPQTASMVPLGHPSQAGVPRIISGTRAPDGSWPWMASVRQAKNPLSGFCGGSVIARNLVLTAAHCVVVDDAKGFKTTTPRPASDFIVVTGQHLLTPITGQVRRVTKVVVNPAWKAAAGGYGGDAALLFLEQDVSAPALVMADPTFEASAFQVQADEWTAGWGSITTWVKQNETVIKQTTFPNELWNVQLDLFTAAQCNAILPQTPSPFWTDWHLCAGRLPATTCNGDSGGPHVVQRNDGSWVQIGVTSIGWIVQNPTNTFTFCAAYDGITRVAAVSAWAIQQWNLYQANKPKPDRTAPRLQVGAQKATRRHGFKVHYRVFDASGETTDALVIRFHGRAVVRARYGFGEAKNKLYFFRVAKRLNAGIYRIEITSRDRAGNGTVARAKLRVR